MNPADPVDAGAKSRHAERVGEKQKYWDYNECSWVPCESARQEALIPAQPTADEFDTDEVTAVETPL